MTVARSPRSCAALHELLGLHASTARSRGTGCSGDVLVEAVGRASGSPRTASSTRRARTGAAPAARGARSSTSCGAADVDVEELPHVAAGDGSPPARVNTVAPPTRRRAGRRDRDRARRRRRSRRGPSTSSSGASSASRTRHRTAAPGRASEAAHEVLAEPARGAGDDQRSAGLARSPGRCRRLTSELARKWSALRAAMAMIAACGLTPGRVGQQRGVVDAQVSEAAHPPEAVGAGRPRSSPIRTRRREVHGHEVRLPARSSASHQPTRSSPVADDRPADDRRVQLGGAGREQHLAEVHQAPGQPAQVGVGEPVGDERRPQARAARHPAARRRCGSRRSRRRRAPSPPARRRRRRRTRRGPARRGPRRLAEPPIVRFGANSVTRCIGTSPWSTGSGKRAATLTVGCSFSPCRCRARIPLRCSSAGVWMAPPHTKTWSAWITQRARRCRRARRPLGTTPVTRSPVRRIRTHPAVGHDLAPRRLGPRDQRARHRLLHRRPVAVVAEDPGELDAAPAELASAPRSSTAEDGGGAPGTVDTDRSSRLGRRSGRASPASNSSMRYVRRHSSARSPGRRWYRPLLISVLPPTQRPSA